MDATPDLSHTSGLIDVSRSIMDKHGVEVQVVRPVDHDVPPGVYSDMTEHGRERDGRLGTRAKRGRKVDASHGKLKADVVGEVEKEEGVLVIRRIHVTYHPDGVAPEDEETVGRVHEVHARHCPVYRTLHRCIDITTEVRIGSRS